MSENLVLGNKSLGFGFGLGHFGLVAQWVLFGVPISGPQLSPLFASKFAVLAQTTFLAREGPNGR